MGDLITPDLPLEELIAVIYVSVNQLMDARQFAVGLYDEDEGIILYKGMIDDNQQYPDIVIEATDDNRFAPWCILNETEIFMNDIDVEYSRYVNKIPYPKAGSSPKAAIYVPLRMNDKVKGVITVRTVHKNVYHKHHPYILKTLGNFVMKSLALASERAKPSVKSQAQRKDWRWCSPEQMSLKARKLFASLTGREKEVLFLMVSGLPNKTMAEKLFVSPGTVKTHTLNIYIKLDVSNRTSAIMKAIELGWLV